MPDCDFLQMVAWRTAGINYVRYSQIAAQVTRQCLKGQAKAVSFLNVVGLWEDQVELRTFLVYCFAIHEFV